MRTTIRIDDQLLKDAKSVAVESGKTLTEVIEDSLRETFARRRERKHRQKPFVLRHTFKGDGVQPGVDLSNSAALLDLMDRQDAPS